MTNADMLQAMRTDLLALNERDRPFTRYFSITHLYNAGISEDELQTYRNGLSKLVNSLSWGRRIVLPQPIDPAKTVFRFDLRDFKWSEKVWEAIIAANPYGVIYNSPVAAACYTATGTKIPVVRADWFVAAASRPPLYHQVLEMPLSDRDLEKQLKVDVEEDIRAERVARAGFNGSGVSRNNRVIERHESTYGAYWKSYDFGSNAGKKNLFAFPLGPGKAANAFEHDGGEIIFNLPNGLQAYMLVDSKGNRLDKGPTAIVSDPKRPDRAVENGISCMSCHAKGMIPKSDQIRDHVQKNATGFPKREADTILALYPAKDKMAALIKDDTARFQKAVLESGGKVGTTEPIVALALRFESEMDLALAAAELGLKPVELKKEMSRLPGLARVFGTLNVDGGTVQRDAFVAAFGEVVQVLKLGTYFTRTAERPKDDLALMQGTWYTVFRKLPGGKPLPKDDARWHQVLEVKGTSFRLTIVKQGAKPFEGKFQLTPTDTPKSFDFSGKGPMGFETELHGIYEVSEDTFKLSVIQSGKGKGFTRVREFDGKDGGDYFEFKRLPLRK